MGKRKASQPKRADESKRKSLTWNMKDLCHDIKILADEDPQLLAEQEKANLVLEDVQKSVSLLEPTTGSKACRGYETTCFESDQKLQDLINNSEFYISVHKELPQKASSWSCKLGTFSLKIQLTDDVEPPKALPATPEFWIYVMEEDIQTYVVYFEIQQTIPDGRDVVVYFQATSEMPYACFKSLQWRTCQLKNFCLICDGYDQKSGDIHISLHALEGSLTKLRFPSEGTPPKQSRLTIIQLMSYYYNFTIPDLTQFPCTKKHDISAIYEEVKNRHMKTLPFLNVSVQHPNLKPRLRDYQKKAVVWMLTRECFQSARAPDITSEGDLHPLYEEFKTLDQQTLYYNKYAGYLVKEKPLRCKEPPGGILADEMGLGKTVEVLSCILTHPRRGLPQTEPLPVMENMEDHSQEKAIFSTAAVLDHHDLDMSLDTDSLLNLDGTVDLDPGSVNTESTSQENSVTGDDQHFAWIGEQLEIESTGNRVVYSIEVTTTNICPTNFMQNTSDSATGNEERIHSPTFTDSVFNVISSGLSHIDDHNYCISQRLDGSANEGLSRDVFFSRSTDLDLGMSVLPECILAEDEITNEWSSSSAGAAGGASVLSTCSTIADTVTDVLPHCSGYTDRIEPINICDINQPTADSLGQSEPKQQIKKSTPKKSTRTRKGSHSDSTSSKGRSPKKSRQKATHNTTDSQPENDTIVKGVQREQDTNFECICGERYIGNDDLGVECQMCGLYQHAKCVNYDLQDPYRGIYLCPHCHVIAPPIPSGATLIIAPGSISHQWVEEIQKHIRKESLKVLVYTGVHKMGFVQPQTLARQDIVILSYETLRKEIDYVDLPHSKDESGRRFRNPKRFMAIPSPIVAVEWWRICLDEAQMVESVTTKTAEMALRLKAINRWCVTGTPIQRSIEDLYGLFVFLGVEPYWVHFWWNELLYKPFCHGQKEALFTVLTETLWRTAKKDVLDQICLPAQTEEVHWLTFSPVEEHFYRRQYRECANEAMQRLGKWTDSETKLNSLDRTTLHQLLHPLVRLRQACCHPQAVKGEFLPIRKSTLTMEELLNQLVKKARLECEESHRQLVFALNGLAALDIIQNNYAEAVDKYRTVLRSVEEHKSEIRTDELQQLHTLHNLHEILLTKPAGVPPTLRDSLLQEQAREIRKKYIARFQQQVVQAQEAWSPVQRSLAEVSQQLRRGQDWWISLLNWSTCVNLDVQLVEKVKEDLADNRQPDIQSMALRFRNVRGLQYIIVSYLDELESTHQALIKLLKKLGKEPTADLINKTVECCLRPADKILKTCPFCEADELFANYESKLFSFVDKGVTEQPSEDDTHLLVATRRQGTWADSECERALKSILAFGKSWGGDSSLLEYGTLHIRMFDALKKEFKCLRTLWLYLRERVSALDELDMATTRMRLRLPDEVKSDIPQPNVLEPDELEPQRMKLKSDQVIYKNELRRKLGQLLYLKNLATAQTDFEGGQNPSPCPVCQRKLGTKWSVLQCGHCYCLECVRILIEQYSFGTHRRSLKCPVCRQRTCHADISYVSTRHKNERQTNDDIKVKGDHSTKVEGIVHCLLMIQKSEPQAKTLVFSTWTDVLDVLSTALYENNIKFKSLHAGNKFQKNLNSFKNNPDVQVLLLPVQSGSNGLNLIEATHVILVEPILNVAQELQAIGRVHRIGQTRPTVVHRFLVRGTIEERMHYLLQNLQMPINSSSTEETTLTIGELSSLFKDQLPTHNLDDEEEDDDDDGGTFPMGSLHGGQQLGEIQPARTSDG